MPKYEVVTAAGVDFPVGMEFETDNLHPVMFQHVRQIGGKAAAKPVEDESEKPLTAAQVDKLHAQAIKEDKERFPPPEKKVDESTVKKVDGPGDNT